MSRIVLTGASGFVGRHALTALLRAGHEVHAVARRTPKASCGSARWHETDLLSGPDIVQELRPEVLIHLAWYVEHGRFWTSPENHRWRDGSLALVRAFIGAGGRRAVLAGSCAEYEWSQPVYAEDALCRPATLYGQVKHQLHLATADLAEQSALSFAWARLFFLYGPNEDPRRFVPAITRPLLAGQTAPMTSGLQVRDFMHTAEAGAAIAALADSTVTGAVNVASGDGVTLKALAQEIAGRVGDGGRLGVGMLPDRPSEPASLVADVRRLRNEVGFHPRLTLEEGIAQAVEWWRTRLAAEQEAGESSESSIS